jgi:hypothetical protein
MTPWSFPPPTRSRPQPRCAAVSDPSSRGNEQEERMRGGWADTAQKMAVSEDFGVRFRRSLFTPV